MMVPDDLNRIGFCRIRDLASLLDPNGHQRIPDSAKPTVWIRSWITFHHSAVLLSLSTPSPNLTFCIRLPRQGL